MKVQLAAAVALVVMLAGCGPAADDAPSSAAGVRVYPLECGRIQLSDMDMFSDGGEYAGRQGELVVTCFLVRHPEGDLIWDTGLPDSLAETAADGSPTFVPRTLRSQLDELGLSPDSIEYVAVSHSHNDHAGNANMFERSIWVSDPAERAWMFRDEARQQPAFANYSALETAQTIDVTEDYDLFGDGTVMIVRTPGHTPGHLALLVRLEERPVLFTGDLYHLKESREHRRVPRFNVDRNQTLASMASFEELADRTGAQVIVQHSVEDFDSLPKPPAYLQ